MFSTRKSLKKLTKQKAKIEVELQISAKHIQQMTIKRNKIIKEIDNRKLEKQIKKRNLERNKATVINEKGEIEKKIEVFMPQFINTNKPLFEQKIFKKEISPPMTGTTLWWGGIGAVIGGTIGAIGGASAIASCAVIDHVLAKKKKWQQINKKELDEIEDAENQYSTSCYQQPTL